MSGSDFKASLIIPDAIRRAERITGASFCVKNQSALMTNLLSCDFPLEWQFHYSGYCRLCQRLSEKGSGFCNILHYITLPERCLNEKRVFLSKCAAGVREAVIPVFFGGELVSVMSLGQCREKGETLPEEMRAALADHCGDGDSPEKQYAELPEIDSELLCEAACLTELCISSTMRLIELTAPYNESGANAYIVEAKSYIKRSLRYPTISSEKVAKQLNISREYLSRLFKSGTGVSVSQYIIDSKVERAKLLLTNTTLPIAEIAMLCGCADPNYFSRLFKSRTGDTPAAYRAQKGQPDGN